jgi:amino acid permease
METKKRDILNSEKNGMFIGLILPFIAVFIIYLYISPDSFKLFFKQAFLYGLYNKVIGFAIIPNFLMYFYFRWKSKLKAAEGISIASLIYLILFVILKYAT